MNFSLASLFCRKDYQCLSLLTDLRSHGLEIRSLCVCVCVCVFLLFLWAAPAAHGGSQARGRIGAVAPSLRQSHSNMGSEPRLRPTPQLTATPDR